MDKNNQFRKKPVVIEAEQYNGPFSIDEMLERWGDAFASAATYKHGFLIIRTLEGASPAVLTDEQRKALNAAIDEYEARGFTSLPRVLRSIAAQPPAAAEADKHEAALKKILGARTMDAGILRKIAEDAMRHTAPNGETR